MKLEVVRQGAKRVTIEDHDVIAVTTPSAPDGEYLCVEISEGKLVIAGNARITKVITGKGMAEKVKEGMSRQEELSFSTEIQEATKPDKKGSKIKQGRTGGIGTSAPRL